MMTTVPDEPATDPLSLADIRWHLGRAFRYGLISGLGLAIDIALFLLLVRAGVGPFAANVTSSGIALTFVYLGSVRRVFRYDGHFIVPLFAAYLFYHVCGTLVVSGVISRLVHAGIAPAMAKVGILPVTFATNYLFMSWLTRKRERWTRAL
ncbi:MAG: GtrA family protein [Sphingomicrobium sp.]